MYIDDTIAAIATPPGIGGVGIIRVSGKDSFPIVNSLFKSTGTVPLMDRQNRTIQYGTIVDPATNKTIDEVLVLLMKGCSGNSVSRRHCASSTNSEIARQS